MTKKALPLAVVALICALGCQQSPATHTIVPVLTSGVAA